MKKELLLVYIILVVLTLVSAVCSSATFFSNCFVVPLMSLTATKFLVVAFYFMELKKAHLFWKTALVLTLFLVLAVITFLKNT